MNLIGREAEKAVLAKALSSPEADLVAVYGRRRVGKTFLIRETFREQLCFELTGVSRAPLRLQLANFAQALSRATQVGVVPRTPASWSEAFTDLAAFLERLPRARNKHVVFFDELPWLASRRSGFVSALEHFWNAWAVHRKDLVVVVCGWAASSMLANVVQARGGLHNRVTRRLRLAPFTLWETRRYLESRRIEIDDYQTLELYMGIGGIPHYLKEVERGESAAQSIDRICFAPDGLLHDEFESLYASLFEHAERHERIVRALARRPMGATRNELAASVGQRSGGGLTQVLEDLEQSGFVMRTRRFGLETKDPIYRVSDEYSLFYLKWIERYRGTGRNVWATRRGTPGWRAWSGSAFEAICLKHIQPLKRALGIEAVETEETAWRCDPSGDDSGAQVDLVIDRADRCINLCEMKFSEGPFVIDKRYASDLQKRVEIFRRRTGTRKTVFLTFVTVHGLHDNDHARVVVAKAIGADALFRSG